MLLIAAFLRATALVVAGYFVWFAASKAEDDRLKTVGKIIAGWCAFFAVVLVIAGLTSAFMHQRGGFRGPGMMQGRMMHGGMMQGGMMQGGMMHGGMPGGMGPRFRFRERMMPHDMKPQDAPPAPKAETPAAAPKS